MEDILLNNMPIGCTNQAYMQGFYYETTNLKKYAKTFEHLGISETIYKVVVEPSYLKTTRSYDNSAVHIRQMIIVAVL